MKEQRVSNTLPPVRCAHSAVIKVKGTLGHGSGPVELNAIPVTLIDRIAVLRDGAAAQYGPTASLASSTAS